MVTYPETNVAEFKERALLHVQGQKSGVTICWKGLSFRDKRQMRGWMWAQRDSIQAEIRVNAMHLRTAQARELSLARSRWDDLLERLIYN